MSRLHFRVLATWLRTFHGLSPDLEEGSKRQEHGEVVLESLPADYPPIPVADVLGRVPSAFVPNGVLVPRALRNDLRTSGVQISLSQ
jgi:hypothetical protein